ncbi:MAG: hypothetical protein QNJ97_01675 [Myxococcota bacterium]|nr:hypothetical protein [Myxococcota bacterium]
MERSTRKDEANQTLLEQLSRDVNRGFEVLAGLRGIDVIVGIAFINEDDTLPDVVTVARTGLQRAGLSGRSAIVCVGPEAGKSALDHALTRDGSDTRIPVYGFLLHQRLEGRGWGIHAIMNSVARSNSALILLPPDVIPQNGNGNGEDEGFCPGWIPRLIEPITAQGQDLALARFAEHPFANPVASLLVYPVMAGVFGCRIPQATPGVMAMSQRLVRTCLSEKQTWPNDAGIFGFDPWVGIHALTSDLAMCEVPLGKASFRHAAYNLKPVFKQVAHVLLDQVVRHAGWWMARPDLVSSLPAMGGNVHVPPPPVDVDADELRQRFKSEFNHFDHTLFSEIISNDLRLTLERCADDTSADYAFSAHQWIGQLQEFLLAYQFEEKFYRDDIVDGLFPFFLARFASFIEEVRAVDTSLRRADMKPATMREDLTLLKARTLLDSQAGAFVSAWPGFRRAWQVKQTETEPYLPRLGAWEFVPQVGVIVPQELDRPNGDRISANQIYKEQINTYRETFTDFLTEHLNLVEVTDSAEILSRVHRFMRKLDWVIDVDLFPYNIHTVEGAQQMTDHICRAFSNDDCFQLTEDAARHILKRSPPKNLIMALGCGNVGALLGLQTPNDALGLAAWTDRRHYLDNVLDIINTDGHPDWFHMAPLKPVVVDLTYLKNATEVRGTAALARLAGRVMVGNYHKGWGGDFRKLWFFLKAVKSIVGVELFSGVWQEFAASGIDFKDRLVASIRGHWGRSVLSAHNAFENRHQRILVERVRRFAEQVSKTAPDKKDAAAVLNAAMGVYHLSITLPDETFVSLCAWTWASYSHRGGVGAPTPLSSLVERDWATRDFVTAYLSRAERGDAATIDKKIAALMGEGRESDDLGDHLFGVVADPDSLMVRQSMAPRSPMAKKLRRLSDGPILEPIVDNKWESRYVLNAAVVRLESTIYILYRAFGEDEISRIGLAWTTDGRHIDGRLSYPIYAPGPPSESSGCEDPRVTVIGDDLYMLYTAWDGELPQIAMASIPVQAFIEGRFDAWQYRGLGFPDLPNKDAVIYPEMFDGKYVIYHRIDPNMWISYLDTLACPWPRTGHQIVVGPRPGMMWDGVKIGAGAPPIKTTRGWLNIYHGVDYETSYRLGVLFTDLDNPARVIYQSPNPILEPETPFEIGKSSDRTYWVPHVVFTCGAVPARDIDVLDLDDEVLVYYGGADTAIGVAKATVRDLVPILE